MSTWYKPNAFGQEETENQSFNTHEGKWPIVWLSNLHAKALMSCFLLTEISLPGSLRNIV